MEGYEKQEEIEKKEREDIFSKSIRAGKRTYFFDVKATRKNDYYLTITESKKKYDQDGKYSFEKHKIFLYKEDFEKFTRGLGEVIEFIDTGKKAPEPEPAEEDDMLKTSTVPSVEFEDLGDPEDTKEDTI